MADKLLSELNQGAWSSLTAYTVGDIVSLNGSSYICVANSTNNTPPNATYWALLSSKGDTGSQGDPGDEVELQVAGGYIQWKYASEVSWTNLILVASLKGDQGDPGDEVELQNSGTYIQWRYVGAVSWTNLVALSAITGPQGIQGIQGIQGETGETGITWQGDWSGATAYVANDVVYRLGSSYICILGHTNQEPPNGTYWELIAQKGIDGEGSGDVVGPASSVTDRIATFDGTTGKLIKDGGKTIASVEAVSIPATYLDTDVALTANSDVKVASQKATKAYVDGIIAAANAMVYKGVIDCSANPNYPAANAGDAYAVSVAGKIGGASGINVEVGDLILCNTDSTSSGNQATVGANWNIIQKNLDGAVIGPASVTDSHVALFDGTTGKLIKSASALLPAKATGAEADTGTDDAKFLTPKAVNDSHNIPSVAPGSSGNVMVSNGTDWTSATPADASSLLVTAAPGSDHNASGVKIALTAGADLAFGDVGYIKSDGKVGLVDADAIATGIALVMCADATIATDASGNFLMLGIARDDTWAWTVGGLIYITVTGTTGNTLSQTAPTGTDDVVIPVGIATHADRMMFKPGLIAIELA